MKREGTHLKVLERFGKAIGNERLAHAYLFVGPGESGKLQAAIDVSKIVNCELVSKGDSQLFCGECPSCQKISSGNHPDVHIITSNDTDTIKIEQIREMLQKTQFRPFEGKRKVFILKDVERLTLESSNALLKTLEEPTSSSLIIMTTSVPEESLSTVRSRCHAVYFYPLGKEKLVSHLREQCSLDEDVAHFLALFSEGCLGKAKRLNDAEIFLKKNDIIDKVCFTKDPAPLQKFLSDKEKTKEVLSTLIGWFRDLALLKSGVERKFLMNVDRLQDMKKCVLAYSFSDIFEIIDELVKTKQLLKNNMNVKVAMQLVKAKI